VASQERGVRGSAPATSALATDHVFSKRSCVTCCQLCLAADRLLRWVVVVMLGEALGIWHRRAVHGGTAALIIGVGMLPLLLPPMSAANIAADGRQFTLVGAGAEERPPGQRLRHEMDEQGTGWPGPRDGW
jgi:hypothetical protein